MRTSPTIRGTQSHEFNLFAFYVPHQTLSVFFLFCFFLWLLLRHRLIKNIQHYCICNVIENGSCPVSIWCVCVWCKCMMFAKSLDNLNFFYLPLSLPLSPSLSRKMIRSLLLRHVVHILKVNTTHNCVANLIDDLEARQRANTNTKKEKKTFKLVTFIYIVRSSLSRQCICDRHRTQCTH